jgi:hypothetical protein
MLLISGLELRSECIPEGRRKAPVICKNRDVATVLYVSKSYITFKVSGAGREPEKKFFISLCITVLCHSFDPSKKKTKEAMRGLGTGSRAAAATMSV